MGPVGCTSVTWLDSPALAAAIRTGFAPGDRAGADRGRRSPPRRDPDVAAALPMAAAGPTSTPNPERRYYAHDAWHTATCTILLPDKGAVMGALAPVFTPDRGGGAALGDGVLRTDQPRTRPTGSSAASRCPPTSPPRCAASSGFKVRASHRRDAARVEGQDVRLADGNALVRVGDRRRGHRPQHLVDHRLRPAAGVQHHRLAGSPRCAWTWPRTPGSPPPASRSASGCPSGGASR